MIPPFSIKRPLSTKMPRLLHWTILGALLANGISIAIYAVNFRTLSDLSKILLPLLFVAIMSLTYGQALSTDRLNRRYSDQTVLFDCIEFLMTERVAFLQLLPSLTINGPELNRWVETNNEELRRLIPKINNDGQPES